MTLESRIQTTEVHALTGMRGFAAFWVFIYHFWALRIGDSVTVSVLGRTIDISACFTFGWLGVTIFFVLSAFLLAQPFILKASEDRGRVSVEKINLVAYFSRRIARVFPAYYVQLLVLSLLAYFFHVGKYPQDLASWLAHLTMTFFSPPFFIDGINGVWWTLPIEFSFYIALPLFVTLFKPNRGILILAVCLGVMIVYRYLTYRMYLGTDVPLYSRINLLPGSMDAFGIGMFGAYAAFYLKNKVTSHRANLATLVMLFLFGVCMVVLHKFWMYYWSGGWMSYTFSVAFSAAIALGAFGAQCGSSLANFLFGNRVLRFLGNVSYSLYLWHVPVITWLAAIPMLQQVPHKNLVLLILCTVVLLVLSWLSWRFIELPAINWCKRITSKRDLLALSS